MKKIFNKYLILLSLLCLTATDARAQEGKFKPDGFDVDDNFQNGWHEVNAGAGVLLSNTVRRGDRPNANYVMTTAGLGYMINAPGGGGFLRGNFEIMPQIFASEIYGGPGNYIAGSALLLRYNFVPRESRLVPYIQFGGGGSVLDIPHRYDGKSFNFNVDTGAGIHYFIRPKCSLNVEYLFQHISNADLWSKNVGLNTSGPLFGVSLFF